MINHIVLILTIKFNLKHVKQKPLEVCITQKVVGFLKFYIFAGYKNINMLLVILFTITSLSLVVYLKPPLLNSLHQMVITGFYTN